MWYFTPSVSMFATSCADSVDRPVKFKSHMYEPIPVPSTLIVKWPNFVCVVNDRATAAASGASLLVMVVGAFPDGVNCAHKIAGFATLPLTMGQCNTIDAHAFDT